MTTLIKQVPPAFKDFAAFHSASKGPDDAFMTHCDREYLHAQWKVLLDDEFLEAYEHGVVIECCDGIRRRFYLRIFSYSADYPEKYVLKDICKTYFDTFLAGFFSAVFATTAVTHVLGVSPARAIAIDLEPNAIKTND